MQRLSAAPGLSVAVYSADGIFARGYGVTDVDWGETSDAETAFYIASSTKPLTSLMMLRLAERGVLDLDVNLAQFAPDAPFAASARAGEVSFRDLLSHRSGILNDAIATRLAYTGQHDAPTLWRLLASCTPNAEAPHGAFQYTNTGYNIATILTDRRFGEPWQDLLRTHVFEPLGMRRTSARMSRAVAGGWKIARPHLYLPEGLTRVRLEKVDSTMQSAGGVVMSARDAVRWLELMIEDGVVDGRRILSAASIAATRAPLARLGADVEFAGYRREAYGLGWYRGPLRDEVLFHHFGGFVGARAHVSYIPARRIGVAVFVNESLVSPTLTDAVANFVYGRSAGRADASSEFESRIEELVQRRDQIVQRIATDRAERASRKWTLSRPREYYAGVYENRDFGTLEVAAHDAALVVSFGVMKSVTEPSREPESVRVELRPGTGETMTFEGAGERPGALRYDGQTYIRV